MNERLYMTSRDSSDISTARSNRALVMFANFSEEQLVITKVTLLGIAEEMKEELIELTQKMNRSLVD